MDVGGVQEDPLALVKGGFEVISGDWALGGN